MTRKYASDFELTYGELAPEALDSDFEAIYGPLPPEIQIEIVRAIGSSARERIKTEPAAANELTRTLAQESTWTSSAAIHRDQSN